MCVICVLCVLLFFRELKFPKFVKDRDFISLTKGMLTKNTMKRLIKLHQIKAHDFFKEFNWDALISFNLDPCYKVTMPAESSKEAMSYLDYTKVSILCVYTYTILLLYCIYNV
jgi:hypothetical protein